MSGFSAIDLGFEGPGQVLLEGFGFEGAAAGGGLGGGLAPLGGDTRDSGESRLSVHLRAEGSQHRRSLLFRGVAGLTVGEDMLGSNAGQITHDDDAGFTGIFSVSASSRTLTTLRGHFTGAFAGDADHYRHFRLSLREHLLSIVAYDDVQILSPSSQLQ